MIPHLNVEQIVPRSACARGCSARLRRQAKDIPSKTHLQWENVHVEIRLHDRLVAVLSTAAFAEGTTQHAIPANSFTVTDWYKQSVYDRRTPRSARSWTFWSTSPER